MAWYSAVMLGLGIMHRILDSNFIVKLFLLSLLYSLVPLSEIFLLIYLGGRIGNYLTLALAALTGLLGMMIAIVEFQRQVNRLKEKIRTGCYPAGEFVSLAGIIIGSIFLLTPGFITDLAGFLLFLPGLRRRLGSMLVERYQPRLKELYEYLKLYDI